MLIITKRIKPFWLFCLVQKLYNSVFCVFDEIGISILSRSINRKDSFEIFQVYTSKPFKIVFDCWFYKKK